MPFASSFKSHGSAASRWGSSKNSTDDEKEYDLESMNNRIENARVRLQDAGVNVETEADKRNWFEKSTNLPEGQNFLFDALELLSRPSQAILNTIGKRDSGDSPLESAWKGFSGQERTRGSELVEDMGIDNKVAKAILGTGVEIALDPLTYIPGAQFAKVASLGAKGAKAGASAAYQLAEKIPAFGRISENNLRPAAESAKDALGYMFNRDYKLGETLDGQADDFVKNLQQQTENARRYMQEESLKTVSDAAKQAGGIESGVDVGRTMEAPLKQFEDVEAYKLPDDRIVENKADVRSEMSLKRGELQGLGKEASQTTREYKKAEMELTSGLAKTNEDIRKLFASIERSAQKGVDKETASNVRSATKELSRIEGQFVDLDKARESIKKKYASEIRASHASRFDLIKRIREVAPKGIQILDASGSPIVSRGSLPKALQGWVRDGGKGIDEVADELGYASDALLLDDLDFLARQPRKLDNQVVNDLAERRLVRSGVIKELEDSRNQLIKARQQIETSLKDLGETDLVQKTSDVAFSKLAEHPQYQALEAQRKALRSQLDDLKGESAQVRQAKAAEIKGVEEQISALRNSLDNPVTIQKEVPRTERELSTDPRISESARTLTQSNDEIRQYAEENGIDIPELEGYMTHVFSAAEREARKKGRIAHMDQGSFNTGNPNKKVIAGRELMGSAEDVNEAVGREMFEPNAYFATAIGQKRLIDYIQAVQFRRKVLSNANFARKVGKGEKVTLGKNEALIDTNNYKFINEGNDMMDGVQLADEIGGQYVVTKAVKNALDRYQRINTDEGTKAFLKAYDAVQNTWKKLTLFSPMYHVRNMAGAMFNNYAGGMKIHDLAIYTSQATKEVVDAMRGKESELYNAFRKQGLGSTNMSNVEFLRSVDPEKSIEKTITERSKSAGGKVLDRVNPLRAFETSREVGDIADQTNRFALFKWAVEKKGMTPEQAAAKVREVQFDYSNLSNFEGNIARVIPFYRWMRNNIPFQIKMAITNPAKYANLNKVRLNAQDAVGINEDNVPDYMKESFAIPVTGDGEGSGKMLGLNLPAADLTKLNDPLKILVDGLSPLLKLPAEVSLNRNFFYNKPIESFEGQEKQFVNPFNGEDLGGIDKKLAYVLEQLSGQMGRGLSGYLAKDGQEDQDTKFRMPSFGISSALKNFDANQATYYQRNDELQKLLDLIRYIEQQTGEPVRSIDQIRRPS